MALATFDIIAILQRELPQLGVPASTVSSLAGISSGKLSSYMNGVNRCPHEHDIKLRKTWAQLKKLIRYAAPLPLNFTRADILHKCIDMMESGILQVVVFDQEPAESETSQQ
jgi:hypothetical protein